MKYISTTDSTDIKSLTEALQMGLAESGGLYVPEDLPTVDLQKAAEFNNYPDFAAYILKPFFAGSAIETELNSICHDSLNFPIPTSQINNNTCLLELFHGPTLSFKDVGARFLAQCIKRLSKTNNDYLDKQIRDEGKKASTSDCNIESEMASKLTILVATSGDTGSAVAAAYHSQPFANVVVLYPKGQVSDIQEQQIVCWGDNVLSLSVKGNFDDCQRIVKACFTHELPGIQLSTSNSINIGRLLPQLSYYAWTSLNHYNNTGNKPGFIVPSGNLGNVTAAYWAKAMGFPIREISIALNENRVLADYISTGEFSPRESIETLANAMDVGNPSNFARLQNLYPDFADFKEAVNVQVVSNEQIKETIVKYYQDFGTIICPHTATACYARQFLSDQDWIIVSTADPAKFNDIVEPLIGKPAQISKDLRDMLDRERVFQEVSATEDSVIEKILEHNQQTLGAKVTIHPRAESSPTRAERS